MNAAALEALAADLVTVADHRTVELPFVAQGDDRAFNDEPLHRGPVLALGWAPERAASSEDQPAGRRAQRKNRGKLQKLVIGGDQECAYADLVARRTKRFSRKPE